ncbi:MBL fold metallo-hydrolase [Kineosporiaceae bacterium SCSIO 59966]|nr:MBL fold metallo-hydrolase [Kineosporiaceae bacterium SCSIO 59966]
MDVVVLETPPLGDRSYLIHDGSVALVVDPQRDHDRMEAAARDAGVRITHVAETHLHNDYLTGGLALARTVGAEYLVDADDEVEYKRTGVRDGDVFDVGELEVLVVATPGHTHHHVSYVVRHGGQEAVFSGGSLLYGSVGRTDLIAPADTEPLTRHQYRSARRLAEVAGDAAQLYPTHGFGSFCSSGPASGAQCSTVAEQRRTNHVLTDDDEDHFVRELIAGLTAYPSYYAHMGPQNRRGPGSPDLSVPEPLDGAELARRLEAGEWVVDLRNRVAFASEHLKGSVSFEYGDGSSFTTFLGWTLPYGDRVTLVGSREDVEKAVRDLSRIGIDGPDAALGERPADLAPGAPTDTIPRVGWAEVAEALKAGGETVLDVRREDEYATSHVEGAVNLPLHDLLTRYRELPEGRLWVHCASGYRSGVAASLLRRLGRDVVQVDAEYDQAGSAGVPVAAGNC